MSSFSHWSSFICLFSLQVCLETRWRLHYDWAFHRTLPCRLLFVVFAHRISLIPHFKTTCQMERILMLLVSVVRICVLRFVHRRRPVSILRKLSLLWSQSKRLPSYHIQIRIFQLIFRIFPIFLNLDLMHPICTLLRIIKRLIIHNSAHNHVYIRILSNHWSSKLLLFLLLLRLRLLSNYFLLTYVLVITDKKTWKEIGCGLNWMVMGRSLLRIDWNVRSWNQFSSIQQARRISIRDWLIQLIWSFYVGQKTSMLIFCDNTLVIIVAKSFRWSDLLLPVETWAWNMLVHFADSWRTRIKCFKNVILRVVVKVSKRLVLDCRIRLSYILFLISWTMIIVSVVCAIHLELMFLSLEPYSLHVNLPVSVPRRQLFNALISRHVETRRHAQLLFQRR